MTAYDWPVT